MFESIPLYYININYNVDVVLYVSIVDFMKHGLKDTVEIYGNTGLFLAFETHVTQRNRFLV